MKNLFRASSPGVADYAALASVGIVFAAFFGVLFFAL
jgi:hypothetical protein